MTTEDNQVSQQASVSEDGAAELQVDNDNRGQSSESTGLCE